uniref:Uncharacterized protein n=1 Tax=Salix viminalis TaxID=40686 RepID=A0A6N2K9L5_SALVM
MEWLGPIHSCHLHGTLNLEETESSTSSTHPQQPEFSPGSHQSPQTTPNSPGKCGKPRCSECHIQPCSKAKHKTKGSHKVKSQDVSSNSNSAQFITWRVVNGPHGSNLSGFSATGMLNQLASTGDDHDYSDDEEDDSGDENDQEFVADDDGNYISDCVNTKNIEEEEDGVSYCDVGFEVDIAEGDEEWCLVAEKS